MPDSNVFLHRNLPQSLQSEKQIEHPGKALEVAVKERVYNDGEYLVTEGVECHEVLSAHVPWSYTAQLCAKRR